MTKSLCYRTANSKRTELSCPNTIIQVGGVFDLQNSLSNLPGFIWSKYPKEKHFPGYSYLGQQVAWIYVYIKMINLDMVKNLYHLQIK